MDKKRLTQLIEILQAGKLSRNKHFDAHCDPDVREARGRQLRLNALSELLNHGGEGLDVNLVKNQQTETWLLSLKVQKWHLRWQAKLLDVEIDWLRQQPSTARHMADLMAVG